MKRKLLAALLLTIPGSVLAADLMVGTWKLNLDKSHFSPGPAPKSVTMRISEDGDWLDAKTVAVDETGKPVTRSSRYKMDGLEYPYDAPQGKGTITIKNIDDHHATATIKPRRRQDTQSTVGHFSRWKNTNRNDDGHGR